MTSEQYRNSPTWKLLVPMALAQSGKRCKKDRPAGMRRSKAWQSMSQSNEPTHFFKVILPSIIEEKKLRIPNKFVKKFGNELSAVSTVTTPNGYMLNLGLHKSENSIWFADGWQEFVEHNSICTGYFLVFRYEGNSNFHVLIFDMTATEIDYPHNDQSNHEGLADLSNHYQSNDENYSGTIEIPTDSSTHSKYHRCSKVMALQNHDRSISVSPTHNIDKHCSSVAPDKYNHRHGGGYDTRSKRRKLGIQEQIIHIGGDMNPARHSSLELIPVPTPEWLPEAERSGEDVFLTKSMCYYSNRKSLSPEQRQDVINAAKKYRPQNPHFMVVVRPYNIYNCYLGVPAKFASKFLRRKSGLLNLMVSDQRKWEMRFYYGGGIYRISKGWAAFARDNKLEEGDVCIFELNNGKGNIEMKVKVFHVSDFMRPLDII